MTYALLGVAVASGVAGTLFAKASEGFRRPLRVLGFLITYGFALFLLAVLMQLLPLGVLYAIWGGAAAALLAAIDRFWFGQRMHWSTYLGLCLVVAGTVAIHLGNPK